MKALIWLVVSFIFAILHNMADCITIYGDRFLTRNEIGIEAAFAGLKAFILGMTAIKLSIFFCRKWDEYKLKKYLNSITAEANAQGMSTIEYFLKDVPRSCIGMCEHCRGKTKELKAFLKPYRDDKQISKYVYIYLFKEYRK